MIKVSFLGDIMCEPLLLKAAKKGNTYDFSGVFENVRDFFKDCDYVVGNLETPLAGKDAGFVKELFSFNAPDEFAQAVKKAGVDFVSTANNHCMDRGIEGLKRTTKVLDEIGLEHDGTHAECMDSEPFVTDIAGTRIAVIPYTYGTNYGDHHNALPDQRHVDLLHADTERTYVSAGKKGTLSKIKGALLRPLKMEQIIAIKKGLGMEFNRARKDDYLDEEGSAPFFERLRIKIGKAKEAADVVIFYPHVGGQFNAEPGRFTEYTIEKGLEYGADAIIASHPHIVQKGVLHSGVPVFYSIGNFSMSPNSVYLLHEHLPEYGLIVNLYIEEKKIEKTTFTIVKIVEEKGKMLVVWPVDEYYASCDEMQRQEVEKDIQQVYRVVTGKTVTGSIVQREYMLG